MAGGPFSFQVPSDSRITPRPPCTPLPFSPLATFQHPASLNVLKQFGQACAILRTTSRASNPAWYQEALELNFQLHIRVDGASISTFYHDRKKAQWSNGPTLTEEVAAGLRPAGVRRRRSAALRPLARRDLPRGDPAHRRRVRHHRAEAGTRQSRLTSRSAGRGAHSIPDRFSRTRPSRWTSPRGG